MDFRSLANALSEDLRVEVPDPSGIKAWRSSWTERALGDPAFDSDFSQLYAVEFFAKCKGLPGIVPQSSLGSFLSSQARCADGFSAPDHVLDLVSDGCRFLVRDYDADCASAFCAHGPGMTVDGLVSFDKWLFKLPSCELTDKIDPLSRFPRTPSLLRLNRFSEVPKTSWVTRGICIEETSAQFLQQGIGRMLRFALTSAGVDLRRQWKTNVSLIRHPAYHTIDLSAASDSISVKLMKSVFVGRKLERWLEAMMSTRAEFCSIDHRTGGTLVKLETFSSMGNGFCFQLLSTLCMAMCIASIRLAHPSFPWRRDRVLHEFHQHFSVYGDDIVVHERYRDHLYYVLASCGFVVNTTKSSTAGRWRESCGAFSYHNGVSRMTTSVPRIRSLSIDTPDDITSLCNLQREVFYRGWTSVASRLCEEVRRTGQLSKGVSYISSEDFARFPRRYGNDPFGNGLVVVDDRKVQSQTRWNKHLQRLEMPLHCYVPRSRALELADTSAIAACLLGGGLLPLKEHYGNACLLQRTRVHA